MRVSYRIWLHSPAAPQESLDGQSPWEQSLWRGQGRLRRNGADNHAGRSRAATATPATSHTQSCRNIHWQKTATTLTGAKWSYHFYAVMQMAQKMPPDAARQRFDLHYTLWQHRTHFLLELPPGAPSSPASLCQAWLRPADPLWSVTYRQTTPTLAFLKFNTRNILLAG